MESKGEHQYSFIKQSKHLILQCAKMFEEKLKPLIKLYHQCIKMMMIACSCNIILHSEWCLCPTAFNLYFWSPPAPVENV